MRRFRQGIFENHTQYCRRTAAGDGVFFNERSRDSYGSDGADRQKERVGRQAAAGPSRRMDDIENNQTQINAEI